MAKNIKRNSVLLIILIGLIGGGAYLYLNFEAMITRQAEKIATNALGVAVDIDGMKISLADRQVTVSGIKIGNPQGYRQPHAVTTDTVTIQLNTATKELIDFKDITVQGSRVIVEINENGMNLLDLKELANSRKQATTSAAEEKIRVIVKQMVIDTSVIEPHVAFMDREIASFTMPAVRFSNVGGGGGVDAGSAITHILTKYLSEAERQARRSQVLSGIDIPGMGEVEQKLNNAVEGIKGLFR